MKRYQVKWIDTRPGEPIRSATVTYENPEEAEVLVKFIDENPNLDLVDYLVIE